MPTEIMIECSNQNIVRPERAISILHLSRPFRALGLYRDPYAGHRAGTLSPGLYSRSLSGRCVTMLANVMLECLLRTQRLNEPPEPSPRLSVAMPWVNVLQNTLRPERAQEA